MNSESCVLYVCCFKLSITVLVILFISVSVYLYFVCKVLKIVKQLKKVYYCSIISIVHCNAKEKVELIYNEFNKLFMKSYIF